MPPINKLFKIKDMYGPKGQSLQIILYKVTFKCGTGVHHNVFIQPNYP